MKRHRPGRRPAFIPNRHRIFNHDLYEIHEGHISRLTTRNTHMSGVSGSRNLNVIIFLVGAIQQDNSSFQVYSRATGETREVLTAERLRIFLSPSSPDMPEQKPPP